MKTKKNDKMIKDGKKKQHEINKNKLCQISLELFFGLQAPAKEFFGENYKKSPKCKVFEVDLLNLEHSFLQIAK
jgi:hypothetical protein